jgi:hypothetical protein
VRKEEAKCMRQMFVSEGPEFKYLPEANSQHERRKTMIKPGALLGAVIAALAVSSTPSISQQPSQALAREGPTLILAAKVPLTGVAGRIDHFTFDPKRRLTIFSGLGNNTQE